MTKNEIIKNFNLKNVCEHCPDALILDSLKNEFQRRDSVLKNYIKKFNPETAVAGFKVKGDNLPSIIISKKIA